MCVYCAGSKPTDQSKEHEETVKQVEYKYNPPREKLFCQHTLVNIKVKVSN